MSTKIDFSKGSKGFVKKLQLCGGSLPLERALMHYGYATYKGKSAKQTPTAGQFVRWAKRQPWLRLEPYKLFVAGGYRDSWQLHLVEDESGRVAS